ncbi:MULTISPECIES: hypothetical protein [unclassified Pseudonocardia]|uniref:hypothetical protein n=1 Tax=unclassified Pseudonocardia TaxID=2619320 RepID=UPI001CF6090E|nr:MULTISPECIES: hypothetical protein [unclassified Pseudonocardia]
MRWWRRSTTTPTGTVASDDDRETRIRRRLHAVETERLEILLDERIPGRRHRLDALALARADLLDDLTTLGAAPPPAAVRHRTPCPEADSCR